MALLISSFTAIKRSQLETPKLALLALEGDKPTLFIACTKPDHYFCGIYTPRVRRSISIEVFRTNKPDCNDLGPKGFSTAIKCEARSSPTKQLLTLQGGLSTLQGIASAICSSNADPLVVTARQQINSKFGFPTVPTAPYDPFDL
jgi:hypothetical protein